jgi:hypothetical protein
MDLIQFMLAVAVGIVLGGAAMWVLRGRKPKTRADALKFVHALYVEALKLPGADEAKAEADTQAVLEKLAADQFAAVLSKAAGGS